MHLKVAFELMPLIRVRLIVILRCTSVRLLGIILHSFFLCHLDYYHCFVVFFPLFLVFFYFCFVCAVVIMGSQPQMSLALPCRAL